jgi:hypothetical protein
LAVCNRNVPVICPIIHQVDNELDAMFLGTLDHSIETLETVGTGVDSCSATGEELKVYSAGAGDALDVVEAPYT